MAVFLGFGGRLHTRIGGNFQLNTHFADGEKRTFVFFILANGVRIRLREKKKDSDDEKLLQTESLSQWIS